MTCLKLGPKRLMAFMAVVLSVMLSSRSVAQTEIVLHDFTGGTDGIEPQGITRDAAGNLFGATRTTIFELSPNAGGGWIFQTLFAFSNGENGKGPNGGFTFDAQGNIYGTTWAGGKSTECKINGGCGVVFELSPTSNGWVESVLYRFKGQADGFNPRGSLVFDTAGNLYGVTYNGGDIFCTLGRTTSGCGTVFELVPSAGEWKLTVLHSFSGGSDGAKPAGGLISDAAGNLYDATVFGGSTSGQCYNQEGCGVVFRLARRNGKWIQDTLHTFTFDEDGAAPEAALTLDTAGNLYGTTYEGGGHSCGTVFELSPTLSGVWRGTVIFAFDCVDGSLSGQLTFDSTGNLYSATSQGGPYGNVCSPLGCGLVFKLSPGSGGNHWTETVLYKFTGGSDGSLPAGGVALDSAGNIYGATVTGGTIAPGVVYEIVPRSRSFHWKGTPLQTRNLLHGAKDAMCRPDTDRRTICSCGFVAESSGSQAYITTDVNRRLHSSRIGRPGQVSVKAIFSSYRSLPHTNSTADFLISVASFRSSMAR